MFLDINDYIIRIEANFKFLIIRRKSLNQDFSIIIKIEHIIALSSRKYQVLIFTLADDFRFVFTNFQLQ